MTPERVNEWLRSRRSVYPKNYTGEIIADDVIEALLANAHQAPTHKLTEPWRFVVFAGAGRNRLFAEMARLYKELTPHELFVQERYDKFAENAAKVSHILAIVMHRDPAERVPEFEEVAAVACAVQNIYLSLNAYNLGGYWSTGGSAFTPEMASFLRLQPNEQCLGFFYLGVKQPDVAPQSRRTPIASKVRWER